MATQHVPGVPAGRRLGGMEIASLVVAVLALNLVIFSIVTDWAAYRVDGDDFANGVSLFSWRMGGWVVAYLVGQLLVELLVVVALAGPASFNAAARVATVVLALHLVALLFFGDGRRPYLGEGEHVVHDSATGPWLAILALLGFAVAAVLAHRPPARRPAVVAPTG